MKQHIFLKERYLLNDFCKILEIEEDIFEDVRGESETLAGLILELTGEIPKKDQTNQITGILFSELNLPTEEE